MYRIDARQMKSQKITQEGTVGVSMQWLIDESHGGANFAMRRFVLEPGGNTPFHRHPWEHEVYVLKGRGLVVTDEGEREVGPDEAILIAPDENHQFCALPDGTLEFICMVPAGQATKH
jgi:quercetin dioxygenase-like cupin family protein